MQFTAGGQGTAVRVSYAFPPTLRSCVLERVFGLSGRNNPSPVDRALKYRVKSFLPQSWSVVTTDASFQVPHGLGNSGQWKESPLQINLLELRDIFLALSNWFSSQGSSIHGPDQQYHSGCFSEPSGVIRISAAYRTLRWAEVNVPALSAVDIPGVDNWATDFLSWEILDPEEWSLHPTVFFHMCQRWGSQNVDRFSRPISITSF